MNVVVGKSLEDFVEVIIIPISGQHSSLTVFKKEVLFDTNTYTID